MVICKFCSKYEATKTIPNPNIGDDFDSWWDVCSFCCKYIKDKQTEHGKEMFEHLKERYSSKTKNRSSNNEVKQNG